jgi:hypothetical protein
MIDAQRSSLSVGVFVVVLTSCTMVIKSPERPFGGYAQAEKIDLIVGLHVTDELRTFEWESRGQIIRPGDYVAQNAELLARRVFREVAIPIPAATGAVDAILTPKLVYVNRTRGATSFGESITSVKVEWNLNDPHGKSIWLETIGGEARGSTGWTPPEELLKQALEEMLLRSQQAFSAAEAIRRFSDERRSQAAESAVEATPTAPSAR